ncbi:hypothetical protein ACFVAJ_18585 [Agromyces sp. NPDC057679]|uniref:hypothetical protein n=1 Tax=Agromyces sp. NPDC057679 TaxID=3346207 RepID=UPI00366E4A4B
MKRKLSAALGAAALAAALVAGSAAPAMAATAPHGARTCPGGAAGGQTVAIHSTVTNNTGLPTIHQWAKTATAGKVSAPYQYGSGYKRSLTLLNSANWWANTQGTWTVYPYTTCI